MALLHAPRAAAALARRAVPHVAQALRARCSCAPGPCPPPPRPPCREPAPRQALGLRVVCCAPPRGARPPCSRTPPPSPRECPPPAQQNPENCTSGNRSTVSPKREECGRRLDAVARRLAAAESARREHYEREAAAREPAPAPAPHAYRPSAERECLRATDGRLYATSSPREFGESRCGPGRTPPPPRPVRVEPFRACEPSRGRHLDPCSHRARIFLEIDRAPPPSDAERFVDTPSGSPRPDFSGRIEETSKTSGSASCPRRRCQPTRPSGVARRAGDASRCANPPPPRPAPPLCRAPAWEHLRRRPRAPCGEPREFHAKTRATPPATGAASDVKPDDGGPRAASKERRRSRSAARGREIPPEESDGRGGLGAGGLELNVPPCAESVRVRVSLDFRALPPPRRASGELSPSSAPGGSDSWLSIKTLQKKLCGRKSDEARKSSNRGNPCLGAKPAPVAEDVEANAAASRPATCSSEQAARPAPGAAPCGPCSTRNKPKETRFSSLHDIFVPAHTLS